MTNTHISPQGEQPVSATNAVEEAQPAMPLQPSAPHPIVLPEQPEEEEFFSFEEEQPDLETAFVDPFQRSNAMPTVSAQAQPSGQASAIPLHLPHRRQKQARKPRFSLTMIAILVCVVVIIGLFVMNVVAQTTPPLQTRGNGSSQTTQRSGSLQQKPMGNQQKPPVKPTPAPTSRSDQGTNGQGQTTAQASSDWVPQQLPDGWINAGLSHWGWYPGHSYRSRFQ